MPVDRFLHPRLGHSAKIAGLSDLTFRVWTQYLLSADDYGVMRASPLVLQLANDALAMKSTAVLAKCLRTLVDVGLVSEFEHQGHRYIYQWDWQAWQKIRYPRHTENPPPPKLLENSDGSQDSGNVPEISPQDSGDGAEVLPQDSGDFAGRARVRAKRLTANGKRQTATGKRLPANGNGLYTLEFLKFWEQYPRKVGKDAAWRTWRARGLPGDLLDTIVTAIESQVRSEQWQHANGRYIPYPATWLNRGSWADELEPSSPVSDLTRTNLAAIEGAKALLKARGG